MKKICKECGREIKGKPSIYDDYYFCTKTLCLSRYLNPEEKIEATKLSKPNRENFLKLADKLYSDVLVNKIIDSETASKMISEYLEEIKINENL